MHSTTRTIDKAIIAGVMILMLLIAGAVMDSQPARAAPVVHLTADFTPAKVQSVQQDLRSEALGKEEVQGAVNALAAIRAEQAAARAAAAKRAADARAAAASASVAAPVSGSGLSSFEACVISRESGGNPRAYNNSSGASGLFGMLLSTWLSLPASAGYPGGAYTAPVSVQEQAFAELYARDGTSPWRAYDGC